MNLTDKQKQWITWGVVVLLIAVMGFLGIQNPIPVPPTPEAAPAPAATLAPDAFARFGSIEANQLRVKGAMEANGGLSMESDKFIVEDATGQVTLAPVADSDTDNYDNWLQIASNIVGLGTKDRVYGLDIELTRPAGYDTTNGDHDDAGIKVRMVNKSTANATGTTLRGIDVNVKNDNPSGAITNLSGGTFTSQTDTGSPPAGNVSTAYALQGQITANAPVTDSLIVADFRNFRQTATEPTVEYGVQIRNGNTTGTGIDRGLSFKSEAATVGDFGYIIDMNDAAASTADVRLSQGETIDNLVDGTVNIGGTTPKLAIGAVTFTGPIKYGTAATYTSGAAITHGFAAAPTMCIIFPSRDVTETLTIGTTTFSSNRATMTDPIYWMCGK